jgi:DNA-directed RNA polymerase subunit RPC12/RpoP
VNSVDVRCPYNHARLFGKLMLSDNRPRIDSESNLMEYACADCKKHYVRNGRTIRLVLHRYNFLGELIETVDEEGNLL